MGDIERKILLVPLTCFSFRIKSMSRSQKRVATTQVQVSVEISRNEASEAPAHTHQIKYQHTLANCLILNKDSSYMQLWLSNIIISVRFKTNLTFFMTISIKASLCWSMFWFSSNPPNGGTVFSPTPHHPFSSILLVNVYSFLLRRSVEEEMPSPLNVGWAPPEEIKTRDGFLPDWSEHNNNTHICILICGQWFLWWRTGRHVHHLCWGTVPKTGRAAEPQRAPRSSSNTGCLTECVCCMCVGVWMCKQNTVCSTLGWW